MAIILLLFAIDLNAQYTLLLDDVNFNSTNGNINGYTNTVEKDIVIPPSFDVDGNVVVVRGIGERAFQNKGLTRVSFSNRLKGIGRLAFNGNELTELIIPDSVATIGQMAFASNQLTKITIPNSVTSIIDAAFNTNKIDTINGQPSEGIIYARNADGSNDVTTIVSYGGAAAVIDFIPQSVTTIGNNAFSYNSLTSVDIPDAVTSIGQGAFFDSDLSSVVLSDNLTYIGESAFYRNNLTAVIIPDKVTHIGNHAFHSNSLVSIIIPSSVKIIGLSAFGFNSLTSVGFSSNSNIRSIGDDAFIANSLVNIQLPAHAHPEFSVYIDDNENTYDAGDFITDFGTGYFVDVPYTLTVEDVVFDTATNTITDYLDTFEKNIVIPASFNIDGVDLPVKGIGYRAFSSNALTAVSIPGSVINIERSAFNSNKIETVNGQPSEGLIYARNFDGSVDSTTVVSYGGEAKVIDFIPSCVTSIGANTFQSCSIDSVSFPDKLKSIGTSAFESNNLTSINIPKSLIGIGFWAFAYNKITSVHFTSVSNILYLGEYAFFQNTNLAGISLPTHNHDDFKEYKDGEGNLYSPSDVISNFETKYYVDIPYTLELDDVQFADTSGIIYSYNKVLSANIIIPSNFNVDGKDIPVTGIGNSSFVGCQLMTLIIPDGISSIGDYAFRNNELSEVSLPEGLTSIGVYAFDRNNLSTITIPESTTYIGYRAFTNNSLTTFTLPQKHTILGDSCIWESSDGNVYAPGEIINDLTFTYSIPDIYNITYQLDGGINNTGNPSLYQSLIGIGTFMPATKEGFTFAGWYSDSTFTTEVHEIATDSEEDIELWAKWDIQSSISSSLANELDIYPIPAKNELNITGLKNGSYNLSIYNMLGLRYVSSAIEVNGIFVLPIENLSAGTYILILENKTGVLSKKINIIE